MRPVLARHRSTLVLTASTLAALAVVLLLGVGEVRTTGRLDPGNPGPTGARAVARVLAAEGVQVEVVRSAAALEATRVDAATTVLVTSADQLGRSTAQRLLEHSAAARLVVVEPGPGTTEALGVGDLPRPTMLEDPRPARCTDETLARLDGLEVLADRGLEYPTTTGCFRGEDGWLLGVAADGLMLLGAGGVLENDQVLRADNAAAALRLLGQRDRLVWYVPTVADQVGDDGVSLRSLLPPWLLPALWLLGLATLATLWWRGRRLGALAVEPLPVVVRAIETTAGRGRLYRAAGDRAHAAEVLRRAAVDDLARHLRLPGAAPQVVARETARLLHRSGEQVEELLGGSGQPPRTDDELIRLATELAELDREVRRT